MNPRLTSSPVHVSSSACAIKPKRSLIFSVLAQIWLDSSHRSKYKLKKVDWLEQCSMPRHRCSEEGTTQMKSWWIDGHYHSRVVCARCLKHLVRAKRELDSEARSEWRREWRWWSTEKGTGVTGDCEARRRSRQGEQLHQLHTLTGNSTAHTPLQSEAEREGVALAIQHWGRMGNPPGETMHCLSAKRPSPRLLAGWGREQQTTTKAIRAEQFDQLGTDDNFLIASTRVLSIELYTLMRRVRNRLLLVVSQVSIATIAGYHHTKVVPVGREQWEQVYKQEPHDHDKHKEEVLPQCQLWKDCQKLKLSIRRGRSCEEPSQVNRTLTTRVAVPVRQCQCCL